MEASVNLSRRGFLRARVKTANVLRPPWATAERLFTSRCTRCNDCVDACETHIVVRGDGGFPEVDFSRGECTFCRACVASCHPQALQRRDGPPWHILPEMKDACLARRDVVCRSCGDVCEAGAIRFHPRLGGASLPEVERTACTGCGACVGACPTQAISINRVEEGVQ